MNSPGADLLALLQDVRTLHNEVGRLLSTGEEILRERGWRGASNDSSATAYYSTGLDNPKQWMASEAFRFYRSDDGAPGVLAFVSVLLLPHASDLDKLKLEEPLVTAGWFQYVQIPTITTSVQWHSRWHGYSERTPRADGSWVETLATEIGKTEMDRYRYGFTRVRTFGRPLVQIDSPATLDALVIQPLLEDISRAKS
ncbi:hypothetical protein [Cystobacter fuscus]|uniref:hypothetical protein n=1 Tax=Cystobacter fuscus TaxID=43 RepID=UPI0012DDBCE7|nr:hypothetical protein [Cystobacter fuscus]